MRNAHQKGAVVLAVVAGSALLALRASQGVASTRELVRPASLEFARDTYEQFACLEHAFDRLAPSGSTVFLDPAVPAQWRQLALGYAFPDRRITTDPEHAEVVFALGRAERLDACAPDAFVVMPGPAASP